MSTRRIEQLAIGADPDRWSAAGFAIADERARVGEVILKFGTAGDGITGWSVDGLSNEIDGLPIAPSPAVEPPTSDHRNGVTGIDHLVVFTPELERTKAALEEVGIECRRVREVETDGSPLRQGFFRLGEVILELVEHAKIGPGPARFWGITFAVEDLNACAELLGDRLGSIRDAVQPGRRIATVRKEAGLGLPVALITEE